MKTVSVGSNILRSGILDYNGKTSLHTTVVDTGDVFLDFMSTEEFADVLKLLGKQKRRVCLRPDGEGHVYFLDSKGFGKALGDLETVVSDPYQVWNDAARKETQAMGVDVVELSRALEEENSFRLMLMLLSLSIRYFTEAPMGQE